MKKIETVKSINPEPQENPGTLLNCAKCGCRPKTSMNTDRERHCIIYKFSCCGTEVTSNSLTYVLKQWNKVNTVNLMKIDVKFTFS